MQNQPHITTPNPDRNATCATVRHNIETIRSIEEEALNSRTISERLADVIGAFCGSITFVVLHILFYGAWILVNTFNVYGFPHFDPYPFMLLSTVLSLEAILLSTFVLMKQNRMSRRADARARLDLQINLLAEKEMTLVLKVLSKISERLELKEVLNDPELQDLITQTPVEAVAQELEQTVFE